MALDSTVQGIALSGARLARGGLQVPIFNEFALLCSYCISNMQSSTYFKHQPEQITIWNHTRCAVPEPEVGNDISSTSYGADPTIGTESNTRAVDTRANASLKFNFRDWTANSRSLSGRCSLLIRRLLELESGFCNFFISSRLGHSTFDKYVSINTSMVNQQLWWTCMILAKVFEVVCNGGTQLAKTAIRLMEYPH